MVLISFEAAKALGLKHYFTGKPCRNWHVAKRLISGGCCECTRAWAKANSKKIKKYNREYSKANPGKANARSAKRHAAKLHATPHWADAELISGIYQACAAITANTGVPHHVDHEIPLQGKLVCGLHHECNLQIITAAENCSKNNSFAV